MNLILNYFNFKKKLNECNEINERFSKLKNFSDVFKNYDLLVNEFKKLQEMKKGPLTTISQNLDDVLENSQKQLKSIYYQKMSSVLSEDDYDNSLGYMNGLLENLKCCTSTYFNGLLQSFIVDVIRVIENYSIIYNNYQNKIKITEKRSFKDELLCEEPLYNEIVKFVIKEGKVSSSLLQRKFRIGYNRAVRIVDLMEERRVIGPSNGIEPRKLLVKQLISNKSNNENFNYFSVVYNEKSNSSKISFLEKIDKQIDGYEFEKISKMILSKNGFDNVEITKASGDFGVDIVAIKEEVKYAIQCKKYSSPVGLKAVQEVIASKSMNSCHVAVVLTNNYFTKSAIELAKQNNVLLWDRDVLTKMIDKI